MSWKDDKNLGPWKFAEQTNKWGYLNNPRWVKTPTTPISYDGNLAAEPQIWTPYNGADGQGGDLHNPCGHWHKQPLTPTDNLVETYIELLSAGIVDQPEQAYWSGYYGEDGPLFDITLLATYRPLNTEDYDGNTYCTFEIVAQNKSEKNDGYVYLVDENDVIRATIVVPKSNWEPIGLTSAGGESRADGYVGGNWHFYSTTFVPLEGDHSYGLRTYIANTGFLSGWDTNGILRVSKATIRINQSSATKSVVHIPMYTDVNGSIQGFVSMGLGYHHVSDGYESLSNWGPSEETYEDNEIAYASWSQLRQVWKFSADELASVSGVVFDAGMGFYEGIGYSTTQRIYGTPDLSWVQCELRWSTAYRASPEEVFGSFGDPTVTNAGGDQFHLIPNSEVTWDRAVDTNAWGETKGLISCDCQAASGGYLYLIAWENVYGGSTPSGTKHHWGVFGNFTMAVGETINYAAISYWIDFNFVTLRYDFVAKYFHTYTREINPGYIILYDKTAGAYVPGSEMVWDEDIPWERKSVELDPSVLVDGHEYIARWKCTPINSERSSAYPLVSDINLWIKVSNMTHFTSFYRVGHSSVEQFIWGWIYNDWTLVGSDGAVNIHSRGKLFAPCGCQVFYECCAYVDFYEEDYSYTQLLDVGIETDMLGDDGLSAMVEGSILVWDNDDGYTYRQRTDALNLQNGHYFVDYSPGHYSIYGVYFSLAGFLVVKHL